MLDMWEAMGSLLLATELAAPGCALLAKAASVTESSWRRFRRLAAKASDMSPKLTMPIEAVLSVGAGASSASAGGAWTALPFEAAAPLGSCPSPGVDGATAPGRELLPRRGAVGAECRDGGGLGRDVAASAAAAAAMR